jgi:hypothetical protein
VQIGATMAQVAKLVKEVYLRLKERGDGPKLELTEEEQHARDANYRERRAKLKRRRTEAKKAELAGVPVSKEQGMCLLTLPFLVGDFLFSF